MSFPASERIAGVTFDVGSTLITANPSVGGVYARVCHAHGLDLPVERCDTAFERAWAESTAATPPGVERYSSLEGGERAWWARLVRRVLLDCGIQASACPPVDDFRDAFASPGSWRIFEEVAGTLEALRERGLRLGVLSNWDSRLPGLLEALGLSGWFETILCSALERLEKPDVRFFRKASESMGLPPSRILHVGDKVREDYRGALDAGMKAFWLRRSPNGLPGSGEVEPAHTIGTLAEIPDLVAGPVEESRR